MNELINRDTQLPDTLEDLTQFVLVGKAKLQAYMLKLQTVNKLSVAQEIRDQTLKETQEVSNALIAAEQRIGELLLAIPKQSGMRTDLETSAERADEVKSKSEVIADMGYERHEASDYQQMAKHPEVVQKVIDDALANGDVVTKASVMREIKFYKDRNKEQQKEIDELRKNKPQVIEKEVIKEVEVVPDDYEELKANSKRIDGYKKDFVDMRNRYEEMAEKWKKSETEKHELQSKLTEPEEKRKLDLKRDCIFFCAGVKNFLGEYGGYTYLKEEIDSLPDYERRSYYSAINAIREWSDSMLGEITIGD